MSTIKVGTLLAADGSTTTQPSIPALDKRMAQAWVNFNGTGNVAIATSFNISSITDINTGEYRANFTAAMPSSYAVVAGILGATSSLYNSIVASGDVALSANYVNLRIVHVNSGTPDTNSVNVIAFSN